MISMQACAGSNDSSGMPSLGGNGRQATPPDMHSNYSCVGDCGSGPGSGSPTGGGGGSGGPISCYVAARSSYSSLCSTGGGRVISLIPPAPGEACDGSQLTLGSQWPVNTSSYDNEVVNIDALQANDANNDPGIAGWEYTLGNGTVEIQGNTSFKTFWTSLGESIPGLGSLIQNFDSGGIVPINSAQAGQITNYIFSHNGKSGSCFTSSLTEA